MHLIDILTPPPDLLPHISDQDLSIIQECFRKVVIEEARGIFKPEEMKLVPLALMREVKKIYMPIPGMYGVSLSFSSIPDRGADSAVGVQS